LPLAVFGLFLGDVLWFELGRRVPPTFFLRRWLDKLAGGVDGHLSEHPIKTLFVSKFAYGMGHLAIMRMGALSKIGIREFLRRDFWSSLPWFLLVWGLGYGTGTVLPHLKNYLRYVEVGVALGVLALVSAQHITRYGAKLRGRRKTETSKGGPVE